MYNSTIKNKFGKCIDCSEDSPDKYLIAKRCLHHYKIYRVSQSKVQQKKHRDEYPRYRSKDFISDLDFWFSQREQELKLTPYCMECGDFIPEKFRRHAVAHIFPKNKFPSVATHRLNYLFLGAGCCHCKSHTIEKFSTMKCFSTAVIRYMQFKDEIKENNKYLSLFEEQVEIFQAYVL